MIKYFPASDIEKRMIDILSKLKMDHIDPSKVSCIRSKGSSARRTIARCHGMPKVLQIGMGRGAHYVIEVISEQFDKLDEEEQTKTIIHELMHIPKNFGGGFRHHDFVNKNSVERMYGQYLGRSNLPLKKPLFSRFFVTF